jgi:mRNA-degrading endonuclease RelE of RelBE toxin-antitoxin system
VISHTAERFRKAFKGLPKSVQRQARDAYKLFSKHPHHPSLRFKQIHPQKPIYSVRVGLGYRAVGVRDGDEIVWYWIGSHANYDKLIAEW